ncbi:hypothetical protein QE152_g32623 [Popillia japonica]|uniref:Integrase catalytic domain-containing protein n=1 Tax=Popillia japonica TaxID=7064 RepID=A0AAW1IYG0_POPJA
MPYSSYEFKKFAKEWNFNICTLSPRYLKSNGLAERAVGICKGMLRTCHEAGVVIVLALLEYRTTPVKELKVSPSELLNNRILRTAIPTNEKEYRTTPVKELKVSPSELLNNRILRTAIPTNEIY